MARLRKAINFKELRRRGGSAILMLAAIFFVQIAANVYLQDDTLDWAVGSVVVMLILVALWLLYWAISIVRR